MASTKLGDSVDCARSDINRLDRRTTMGELMEQCEGVDERKLVRKLDLYLIPLIMGLYLFSFLDRFVHHVLGHWSHNLPHSG